MRPYAYAGVTLPLAGVTGSVSGRAISICTVKDGTLMTLTLVHHCSSKLSRIHSNQVFVATTRYDWAPRHCKVGRVAERISEDYNTLRQTGFVHRFRDAYLAPSGFLPEQIRGSSGCHVRSRRPADASSQSLPGCSVQVDAELSV